MLYSFFDVDKNGVLDYSEVSAALVILCKGSVAEKISFAMRVFSSTYTESVINIDFKEFRRLIHFIFRLSLETKTEILLDYDLEKLADHVAKDAFKFSGVDEAKGKLDFKQVMKYINKPSLQEMK